MNSQQTKEKKLHVETTIHKFVESRVPETECSKLKIIVRETQTVTRLPLHHGLGNEH